MELKSNAFVNACYKQSLLDDNYRKLCAAIIAQAIEDYRVLRDKPNTAYFGLKYSHSEIISFLKCSWCQEILSMLNVSITGAEIAIILESEKEKPSREVISTRGIFNGGQKHGR